jgi:uncharacterized SAM-binding protein YcdF (DUF218 family)
MFELLTQILILVGLFFLVRFIIKSIIGEKYLSWLGGIILVLLLLWAFREPTNEVVSIVWSIISFFITPLGLTLFLLSYSMREGIKKANGTLVAWALAILLVFSLPLTAYFFTTQTEQQAVINAINQREDATAPADIDAIVVLGDGTLPTDPSYRIRTQLNNADDGFGTNLLSRLSFAAQMYEDQVARGNDPLVIISAGPQPEVTQEDIPTARYITETLGRLGVPQDRILIESQGVDIRSSALSVQQVLADRGGGNQVMLVAPVVSIRRAALTFENLGLDVVLRPTDFYVFQLQRGGDFAFLTDLIPSAEALVITTRAWTEFLAYYYYLLRGWLADPLGLG